MSKASNWTASDRAKLLHAFHLHERHVPMSESLTDLVLATLDKPAAEFFRMPNGAYVRMSLISAISHDKVSGETLVTFEDRSTAAHMDIKRELFTRLADALGIELEAA